MFSREEIAAVIYGGAVADALGAPFEFSSKVYGPIEMSGGKNQLGEIRPGEWTDDTEMTLMLAESISEGLPLRWQGLARRYIDWASREPKDIGNTTKAALSGAADFREARRQALSFYQSTGRSAGNGTIMRAAPLAFLPLGDEDLAGIVRVEAAITHAAREAFEASLLQALAIRRLLRGEDPLLPPREPLTAKIEQALEKHRDREYVQEEVALGGTAWSSLAAALWSLSFDDYTEGVKGVIALGYDTDTNASCAGALLAARDGLGAIPEQWRELLLNKPRIERAIDGLSLLQESAK